MDQPLDMIWEEYMEQESQCLRSQFPQVPLIKEVLSAMEFPVEKAGYEADDIIGTLANESEKLGYDVSVVSGDRDLLLISH